ncbi:uncharacterized protein CLUP02_10800 [Colletotrichum lupini]|uniref:Uncharacterized protein n=1 Tax=Colletotrichum lupini TaxID=145971 RepID=A0A9Q8SXF6_9PEZI|nr:uncharacterized protein CLUP02_10800 [Colletotrichum lupini]UQC85303.1 hypothetical protein CLUP02_10800 [Colletotrichum lupini]
MAPMSGFRSRRPVRYPTTGLFSVQEHPEHLRPLQTSSLQQRKVPVGQGEELTTSPSDVNAPKHPTSMYLYSQYTRHLTSSVPLSLMKIIVSPNLYPPVSPSFLPVLTVLAGLALYDCSPTADLLLGPQPTVGGLSSSCSRSFGGFHHESLSRLLPTTPLAAALSLD